MLAKTVGAVLGKNYCRHAYMRIYFLVAIGSPRTIMSVLGKILNKEVAGGQHVHENPRFSRSRVGYM